eukprot:jgi/Picre1/31360/NNA_006713.t1
MGVFDRLKLPTGKRSLETSTSGSGREGKKINTPMLRKTIRDQVFLTDSRCHKGRCWRKQRHPVGWARKQVKRGNGQQGKKSPGSSQTTRKNRNNTNKKREIIAKNRKEKFEVHGHSRDLQKHGSSRKKAGQGVSTGPPVSKGLKTQRDGPSCTIRDGITRGVQVSSKDIDTQGLRKSGNTDEANMKRENSSDNHCSVESQSTAAQKALSTFLESNDSAIAKCWYKLQWGDIKPCDTGSIERGEGARLLEMVNALQSA